eukprot:scaffold112077_cov32-Tisochrysis_lutea.AAC.3
MQLLSAAAWWQVERVRLGAGGSAVPAACIVGRAPARAGDGRIALRASPRRMSVTAGSHLIPILEYIRGFLHGTKDKRKRGGRRGGGRKGWKGVV